MTATARLDWTDVGWDAGAAPDGAVLAALADQDAAIDREGVWPESSWREAKALGVHRWHVPTSQGGAGLNRDALLYRGARLAESSLVLAFIASQHDAAVRRLAASATPRAVAWLERIAQGEAVATVGLSHLTTSRRLGTRPLAAQPATGGGYVLNGAMPWVTSATHADVLVTGAVLDDGRQILVALPTSREGVQVGPPMPLAALGASCTCEVGCREVGIAAEEVLYGPATDVAKLPGLAGTGGLETSALAVGKARAAILGLSHEAESREEPDTSDRDRLRDTLASLAGPGTGPIWLVLIGHGTSDGRDAKFNLRGPDFSDTELADWLAPLTKPLAILDGSSSSGPFLSRLSGEGRVVITGTRSGNESNYARFGGFLAAAIDDPTADLDKDGQVSLLEAFLKAGARTVEFYQSRSRLATEHALLDDNGDKLGTPADWFRGVRAVKRAKEGAPADGPRAHQWHLVPSDRERSLPPEVRRRRDQLELELAALRDRQPSMTEDDYFKAIEPLLLELARLYTSALPAAPTP